MLFLLDNGAHSIKLGHDHEPRYFILFRLFLQKQKTNKQTKSPTHRTRTRPAHTSSVFQNAVVRSKGDKQSYYGHEIPLCRDRSSLHYRLPCEKVQRAFKHIIPAHSHQGLHRRLGCAKGNLGWDVPPIPKGTLFFSSWSSDITTLQHELHQADISESSVLVTEPYFNLPQIQRIYDQFIFEEYGFESYYRCTRLCILAFQTKKSAPDSPLPKQPHH